MHVLVHYRIVTGVVSGGYAHPGLCGQNVVEDVPLLVKGTHTQVVALTDGRGVTESEVLGQVHGDVGIQVVALEAEGITLQDRVIVGVTHTEVVVDSLGTTGEGGVVLLVHGEFLVALVVPVGIDSIVNDAVGVGPGGITILVSGDGSIGELGTVSEFGNVSHGVVPLHEGSPILHLAGDVGRSQVHRSGEAHGRLLDLTLLGGDEDNTVLSAETVNGSGSVLQNGDALDVVGVQFLENGDIVIGFQLTGVIAPATGVLALTGNATHNTIHNDHRVTITTDAEVGVELTGLTAVLGNLQTGNLTLESVNTIGGTGRRDVLRTNLRDRTREGLTLLDTITHNHSLVEELGVFHKDNVHLGSSLEGTCFEADGGELQDSACGNSESELTVNIGSDANSSSLLHDGSTDDRFLLHIRDRTGHRDVLGQ